MRQILKAKELQLADTIELWSHAPWGDAIVTQITEDTIHMRRPYGSTADFSYTGGVIFYTGLEQIDFHIETKHTFVVVERKTLK